MAVGANSSLNFIIKNTGNADLTGLTISLNGADAGMFTVTANPTAPVSGPNGTTAFTVRFAPTSVGLKTAAIHIASNDPDESPFDITLTGGPPAAPEIAVERSGVNIADGGSVGFVTATVGSPADVVFTVRNTGSAPLALNGTPLVAVGGTDAALFSLISPPASTVGAGDSTTFIVRYAPLDSSPKTATLSLANNDTDEQPFDLNLTGAVLSFTTDTDGDGFSDAAELQMAALGYDWQVSQTALVNTFTSNANGLGYYTAAQVQALNLDVPLIQRDGLGQFKLTLGMKKSTDLVLFNPFPMNQPEMTTTINGEGKLEIQFTVPDNAAFFRLQAQ
ncbi:MAG: choice-of-anchor D domain-containing protein [Verrucomicrobiota bacterium]|nr:choice-of-anchor D domain-containing protein [Verrucomicrobiota bacterium]